MRWNGRSRNRQPDLFLESSNMPLHKLGGPIAFFGLERI
jgi:hypothetical protein